MKSTYLLHQRCENSGNHKHTKHNIPHPGLRPLGVPEGKTDEEARQNTQHQFG
jgi:hypothetical protein